MNIKYFLYARKSLERDDKQVASIDDQITEMRAVADKLGLTIVDTFVEAKSAKTRGRPVFNEMLERIKKGEAKGIICWKLNRLARNPYDAGEITGLLQEKAIERIQTYANTFLPSDNVMLMMIEFGIATQFSKDLSQVVQRGIRRKAHRGWFPQPKLTLGYRHNPERIYGEKEIIPDKERFFILQQLWSMLATGAFSLSEVREKGKILGLTSKSGGFPSYSSFQRMFTNPFYMGVFYWKDEDGIEQKIEGKHEPMVSEIDFIKVQDILQNRKTNNRIHTYRFIYNGLLRCGECNGHIGSMRKRRAICTQCKSKFSIMNSHHCNKCGLDLNDMNKPSILDITYYYCTKNKKKNCTQKYINETEIDNTILAKLHELQIDKEFYMYAKSRVSVVSDQGIDQASILLSLKKKEEKMKAKNLTLIDMRSNGELSSEDFLNAKKNNESDLKIIALEISKREQLQNTWRKEAHAYLDIMLNAVQMFKTGDYFTKRIIIETFALNPTIMDKTLCFSTKKPLEGLFIEKK